MFRILRDPIHRRVGAVTVLGAAVASVVVAALPYSGRVLSGPAVHGAWLPPGLVAGGRIGALALGRVRARHGPEGVAPPPGALLPGGPRLAGWPPPGGACRRPPRWSPSPPASPPWPSRSTRRSCCRS